jgi:putative oxidoreductase
MNIKGVGDKINNSQLTSTLNFFSKKTNMIDTNESSLSARLELSLFLLRLGVFIVMLAWALDKIFNPGHAIMIFEEIYFIRGLGDTLMMSIGVIELIIILAFMAGLWKRYTYGFVIMVHAISAIAPWEKYTIEIGATYSLLYYADWPMLAACITLYVLRDLDVKFTVGR